MTEKIPHVHDHQDGVHLHAGRNHIITLSPDKADLLADELRESAKRAREHLAFIAEHRPPMTQSAIDERDAAEERLARDAQEREELEKQRAAEEELAAIDERRARLEAERGRPVTFEEVQKIVRAEMQSPTSSTQREPVSKPKARVKAKAKTRTTDKRRQAANKRRREARSSSHTMEPDAKTVKKELEEQTPSPEVQTPPKGKSKEK